MHIYKGRTREAALAGKSELRREEKEEKKRKKKTIKIGLGLA